MIIEKKWGNSKIVWIDNPRIIRIMRPFPTPHFSGNNLDESVEFQEKLNN